MTRSRVWQTDLGVLKDGCITTQADRDTFRCILREYTVGVPGC